MAKKYLTYIPHIVNLDKNFIVIQEGEPSLDGKYKLEKSSNIEVGDLVMVNNPHHASTMKNKIVKVAKVYDDGIMFFIYQDNNKPTGYHSKKYCYNMVQKLVPYVEEQPTQAPTPTPTPNKTLPSLYWMTVDGNNYNLILNGVLMSTITFDGDNVLSVEQSKLNNIGVFFDINHLYECTKEEVIRLTLQCIKDFFKSIIG